MEIAVKTDEAAREMSPTFPPRISALIDILLAVCRSSPVGHAAFLNSGGATHVSQVPESVWPPTPKFASTTLRRIV